MWPSDLREITKNIRRQLREMEKSARQGESDEVEEIAKDIESQAGVIVADMQIKGIFVGVRDMSNDRIADGDFGPVRS